MRSIPAPSAPLDDGQITLRLAAERDIPEILIAYQDDPQLHLSLGADRPPSGAELGRGVEHVADDMAQGIAVRLTITDAGADDCRGQVIVQAFDWENHRAEISVWIVPQLRNQGIARRALALTAAWLFQACALKRIALMSDPRNEPMLHAARGAGFVEEGVLRGYKRGRGNRLDTTVLSLIPADLTEDSTH